MTVAPAAVGYLTSTMIRRFPVRLQVVTPGPRADALVDEVCALLAAERLPSLPGEVTIAVAGIGQRDAARRAERMLAGQGFGWSAHVRLAEPRPDPAHVPGPSVPGAPRGTGGAPGRRLHSP